MFFKAALSALSAPLCMVFDALLVDGAPGHEEEIALPQHLGADSRRLCHIFLNILNIQKSTASFNAQRF